MHLCDGYLVFNFCFGQRTSVHDLQPLGSSQRLSACNSSSTLNQALPWVCKPSAAPFTSLAIAFPLSWTRVTHTICRATLVLSEGWLRKKKKRKDNESVDAVDYMVCIWPDISEKHLTSPCHKTFLEASERLSPSHSDTVAQEVAAVIYMCSGPVIHCAALKTLLHIPSVVSMWILRWLDFRNCLVWETYSILALYICGSAIPKALRGAHNHLKVVKWWLMSHPYKERAPFRHFGNNLLSPKHWEPGHFVVLGPLIVLHPWKGSR